MTYTNTSPPQTLTTPSSPWATPPAVVCDFGWYGTQTGQIFGTLIYVVNGQTYPPGGTHFQDYTTTLNQPVTFDAFDTDNLGLPVTIVPSGVTIVSFSWDLGNGVTGLGPVITTTYTYNNPPPDTAATLTVTDSIGRTYSTTHRLNLSSSGSGGSAIGLPIGSGHV